MAASGSENRESAFEPLASSGPSVGAGECLAIKAQEGRRCPDEDGQDVERQARKKEDENPAVPESKQLREILAEVARQRRAGGPVGDQQRRATV